MAIYVELQLLNEDSFYIHNRRINYVKWKSKILEFYNFQEFLFETDAKLLKIF